ncbi:MAG: hypothetical protein DRO73_11640 [Candidatus Thorarchaeota archaeon]|nr:MAG: hypothetical protein DRO73_11640 [Candidatus Thorarchaeota archaeon]RLI56197.1 MAG: hypothetical protein DRO93_11450 [Candidatus Thorarchaeota archaeon]
MDVLEFELLIIMGFILCVLGIAFEHTDRFKARAKTLSRRSSRLALYAINITLSLLMPLQLLMLAFLNGLPLYIMMDVFMVGLAPTIGFGIVLTQHVTSGPTP